MAQNMCSELMCGGGGEKLEREKSISIFAFTGWDIRVIRHETESTRPRCLLLAATRLLQDHLLGSKPARHPSCATLGGRTGA